MSCFCPSRMQPLSALMPRASLSVGAVPMQMPGLIAFLGMGDAEGAHPASRVDLKMNAMLGTMHTPSVLPFGVPPLMSMTAQMASLAGIFPLDDLAALIDTLKQALHDLTAHLLPLLGHAARLPRLPMANMVLAARMTLSLRAKGLCPMALSGVDHSYATRNNFAPAMPTLKAALSASARAGAPGIPAFGLSVPQLSMAMSLAGLAPLATMPTSLGLPAIGSSNFAAAAMAALARLAQMPAFPLDVSSLLSQLARLSDLAAIQQAFGMDAMSPAGVSRVQVMLNFMSRLRLPALPSLAMSLQPKLDMLPPFEAVQTGAQVAHLNVQTFSTAMRFSPIKPPVLSLLSALNALKLVLADALGITPHSACPACKMAA